MFLPFILQAVYDKTNMFIIRNWILWCWLFFVTFVIRRVPYIGWWWYVRKKSLIVKIWFFFLNALFCHSQIVINLFHSCKITICQTKKSKARKNNIYKYITPFPWLIIINILYYFGEFDSSRNTEEFSRWYGGLKNFTHPQVSVHSHEISSHSSLISAKYKNVPFVKVLRFWFKYGMRLVIHTRTKNIIYHLVGRNHFIYNG